MPTAVRSNTDKRKLKIINELNQRKYQIGDCTSATVGAAYGKRLNELLWLIYDLSRCLVYISSNAYEDLFASRRKCMCGESCTRRTGEMRANCVRSKGNIK